MKRHIIKASILLSAVVSPAHAVPSLASGWYVDGTLGSSKQEEKSHDGLSSKDKGLAGSIAIGYKFMPFVAGELGATQYALQKLQDSNGTTVVDYRTRAYYLAAKGIVPIGISGFEPFAKVGISRLTARAQVKNQAAATAYDVDTKDHSATGLYLGAGAQYYFLPELAIIAEWARANGNTNTTGNMNLYSIGLSYIFG